MKTERRIHIRRVSLEYCLIIRLENRPLNIPKSLALVKESTVGIEKYESGLNPSTNENKELAVKTSAFPHVKTYDQVHLLWLWTGILNVSK